MKRIIVLFVLLIGLSGCIAVDNGVIFKTADPSWGVKVTFPAPEIGIDEPEIFPIPECEVVKGNISQDGRKLYHLPGMANYNQVKIDEAAGEAFFCTVGEAEAAGWVKAGN